MNNQQSEQPSKNTTFKVYYRHNQTIVELRFKHTQMRVEEVIFQAINELSNNYMIKLNNNILHYALFPASKLRAKTSDAIQISHGQKIKSIGLSKFYLQYLNLSKQSISTEINLQKKYGFEKKIQKQQSGCCSMFNPRVSIRSL